MSEVAGSPRQLSAVSESAGSVAGLQHRRVDRRRGRGQHAEQERRRAEERGEVAAARGGATKLVDEPGDDERGREPGERPARERRRRSRARRVAVAAVAASQSTTTAGKSRRGPRAARARAPRRRSSRRGRARRGATIATSAKTPASTVYQSRMPSAPRGENDSKSGSANQPSSSSGTPRRRLPSAAPKQHRRERRGDARRRRPRSRATCRRATWERNSIAMPRRISTQSTRKIAR